MILFSRSILVLISLLFISSCAQNSDATAQSVKDVSVSEFKLLIETGDGILLDVRTPDEISGGYIENSTHINYYDSKFEQKLSLIPKDKTIYVYCLSGGRSLKAAQKLLELGQSEVYNLKGGIRSWKSHKYPLELGTTISTPTIKSMSMEELQSILSTESIVLIDFHTEWCVPCKKMAPVIEEIEKENTNRLKVVKLDLDAHEGISNEFNITAVPTYLIYKNGKEVWRASGTQSKENIENQIF
jgi:thioredoxin